jgi:hypothetical protein
MTREEIIIKVLDQRVYFLWKTILEKYADLPILEISYYEGKLDGYNQALDLLRSSDECNAVELEESK